ncbi:conserved Plasmodium protein, unknown function [Plasmodium malariae]|uniref:Uncharacterized protein n=3 Tax=Plasmodium (Plasmodium) TaxID=418103 RepID=A0A1D3SPE6_PLAMA|nr:conserved Plasmodium protein, unknown function [Plasmodium malariae]SCO93255.1 conserved Plasmodium protein, unknown function [Plasmodium malariae]
MGSGSRVLIALGNEIRKENVANFKRGDISLMYVDYLNRKYNFGEWIKSSNINSYICEKNNVILIKPIISLLQNCSNFQYNVGKSIKNMLSYLNYNNNPKNICFIIPDTYRPTGKYKFKNYIKIHEKLGSDFYNILNSNIINNLNDTNYLQLYIGINKLHYDQSTGVNSIFHEPITEQEYKVFYKTFQLADEYFNKKILNANFVTTNFIVFKKKYPAMEPQKHFKENTSTRRYILDVYRHMYK